MKAEASNQKLAWFKREFRAKTLDLSPEFQRNPVWSNEEASYLVDTVLSGLPFPEVYLRSKTNAKAVTKHEVVDGQQRIRSLLQFGRNDLILDGNEVSPKFHGKCFDDLTEKQQEDYWNYTVVVRDLGDASDAEIRDLFRRLNIHSVVLNDQELRNARYRGVFIRLMESLAEDSWWTEIQVVTPKQVRRMEDIEYVSELFVGLMTGPQNKKDPLDEYYEEFEKSFPDKEKHTKIFADTKALIVDILTRDDIIDWSGKSDFYSLFLAFGELTGEIFTRSQKERIALALGKFRKAVDEAKRKDAEDITNKKVWKYVQAVSRAASDIDRRKTRIDTILSIIRKAID